MKNYIPALLFCLVASVLQAQEVMITRLEYFVDSDPGVGLATPLKVTTGSTVELTYDVPVAGLGLDNGFHIIGVRAGYSDHIWGFAETRLFYVQPESDDESTTYDVAAVEYFFDEDPGIGNATQLGGVVAGSIIDVTSIIPTTLEPGWHVIGIRSRNTIGKWGFTEKRPVYVDGNTITTGPTPQITQLEYFYNEDPGIGSGTKIDINPDAEVVDIASMLISTSETIPIGMNDITIRAQNDQGTWGFGETQEFEVVDDCDQPTANFEVDMACAGETILFNDLSINLQDDATYRWYLDGDDEFDDTNKGDVAFTYQNPGTYTVALAISQGQICYDSIAVEVVVKAKPIVVFNADPVTVGASTDFEVTQFNVNPTAVWNWDFESDGTIDDNTVGSVSHTYPSAGDYQAKIAVTDNNGCGTSFSREVTVHPPGGGGGDPVANFQATTECLGEETVFTDLSQSIPGGSTYSWDFNGDGTADDSTIGSPTYAYLQAGSYSAMLTITLPDETTLMHTEIVHVRPEPFASFSAAPVCIGETTLFISGTEGIDSNTIFSWDFNGDDVEDSDDTGDVEFTYTDPGQYLVVLTVDNGGGCFDVAARTVTVLPEPEALFSTSEACAGEAMQFTDLSTGTTGSTLYSWDFDGDGTIDNTTPGSVEFTFPTTGDYTTSLILDNGSGCTSTLSKTISFRSKSDPDFSVAPVCQGGETVFTDLSTDVDEEATYAWDFDGNGSIDSDTKGNTTFTYTEAGTYTAILTINSGDCPARTQKTVTVYALPQSALPETVQLCTGESVVLDPGSGFSEYLWSDESTGQTLEVNTQGTYAVTLKNVQECETTSTVVVEQPGQATPAFETSVEALELSARVSFENTSQEADQYLWDFGDGNTSVESNPVHEFENINFFFGSVFDVCLTAFNDCTSQQYCEVVALVVTSNEELLVNEIGLFPNPVESVFTLVWSKDPTNSKIRLLDINGVEIWTKDFPQAFGENRYALDIESLSAGQYIVEVISPESVYRNKLIKN